MKTLHLVTSRDYSQGTYCNRDVTPKMRVTDNAREFDVSQDACQQCLRAAVEQQDDDFEKHADKVAAWNNELRAKRAATLLPDHADASGNCLNCGESAAEHTEHDVDEDGCCVTMGMPTVKVRQRAAKRAARQGPMTYQEAVELVALNDNPDELNIARVADSVAVQLIADIYRTNAGTTARTIVRYRKASR